MTYLDRIREIKDDKSLNINEFSSILNMKKRTIENYLGGLRPPSAEFLTAISENMGVSSTWILTGMGDKYIKNHSNSVTSPDFVSVPRYDVVASAGHGTQPAHEEGTGHYAFNRKWIERRGLNVKNLAVISVEGDSMEPELHDNDLIVLDHSQTKPKDGDIFVVRYSNDLFVKRVQHLPKDKIELRSTNSHYRPIEISLPDNADDFTFIGKVVASMHEW